MMTRGRILTVVAGLVTAVIVGWNGAAGAQQAGAQAPFTDAQAMAGQAAYGQACAACHGATLTGGGEAPPLAGPAFIGSWGTRSTRELLMYTRESMPPDKPNSLNADTYFSIVAFVLK